MKKATYFYLLRRGFFAGGGGEWSTLVNAFKTRVLADGGTLESESCIRDDVKYLIQNPEPVPVPAFTGLLNDYSGAAAAYSLRLLDNTYTGNAIKVRRASDNAEQDIAFSNNELDTATLETFASGTDAFVTTWYDQSGNGNDATQTTATKQPKIVNAGSTILESGKPIITKTDNDSKLNTTLVGTQNASFFGSFLCDNFSILLSQSAVTTNPYLGVARLGDTGASEVNVGNISYYKNGTIISTPNRDTILSSYETQSVGSIFIDNGLGFNTDGYAFGYDSSSYSMYDMQEFIIYPNDQNTNRTGIETNINDFYSIY